MSCSKLMWVRTGSLLTRPLLKLEKFEVGKGLSAFTSGPNHESTRIGVDKESPINAGTMVGLLGTFVGFGFGVWKLKKVKVLGGTRENKLDEEKVETIGAETCLPGTLSCNKLASFDVEVEDVKAFGFWQCLPQAKCRRCPQSFRIPPEDPKIFTYPPPETFETIARQLIDFADVDNSDILTQIEMHLAGSGYDGVNFFLHHIAFFTVPEKQARTMDYFEYLMDFFNNSLKEDDLPELTPEDRQDLRANYETENGNEVGFAVVLQLLYDLQNPGPAEARVTYQRYPNIDPERVEQN